MTEKLKIGITTGDINGIGPEIILKTLADTRLLDFFTPVVYGNVQTMAFHRQLLSVPDVHFQVIDSGDQAQRKKLNLVSCWDEDVNILPGEANTTGGAYAFRSLDRAVTELINHKIDALVTAPIDKHTIQNEQFNFPGHTEYIQSRTQAADALMFMVGEDIRVGVVTGHIPVHEVAGAIRKESILSKLALMHASLKTDFWVQKPRIAVLGLNRMPATTVLSAKKSKK